MAVHTDPVMALGGATTKAAIIITILQNCGWNTSEKIYSSLTPKSLFLEDGPANIWTSHISLRCENTETSKSKISNKMTIGRLADFFIKVMECTEM